MSNVAAMNTDVNTPNAASNIIPLNQTNGQKVQSMHNYFDSGMTLPYEFRLAALNHLGNYIENHLDNFYKAMYADLGKAPQESYEMEIGLVLEDIGYIKKHLHKWMKPKRVLSPLSQFPAKSYIYNQPFGVTLIMAPWNYPFLLTIEPLTGSIAAGNCTLLKPAHYSAATSTEIAKMIEALYPKQYIDTELGGHEVIDDLLKQNLNYIFFTGSVAVGKIVLQAAVQNVTPVTLELGGQSPCFVDETANIPLAAKRIVFGKYANAGQTCVCPDYVLAHKNIKDKLIADILKEIKNAFGEKPISNPEFPKIIDSRHFARVMSLLKASKANIVTGGETDEAACKIAPTVLDNVAPGDAIMSEEIFGPILPVLSYENIEDALKIVKEHSHPLAMYIFSENKKTQMKLMHEITAGGGCINDTLVHLASSRIPFGGVGKSGMGRYHGKYSYDTFSNIKGYMVRGKIDLDFRYHPYSEKKLNIVKKLIH